MRCEIQVIDQHWSLRRLTVSLPNGEPDESLADSCGLAQSAAQPSNDITWPRPEPARWRDFHFAALESDLASDLPAIRARQSQHLRRELDRVDDYFEHYEQELAARAVRSGNENTTLKAHKRLAAAKAERARRRADQMARHGIRIHVHLGALLLIAEAAWRTRLTVEVAHRPQSPSNRFVPRARGWLLADEPGTEQ